MASMLEYLQEMERRKALGMTPGVPYASRYPSTSTYAPFQNLKQQLGYYKSNVGDIASSSNPVVEKKPTVGRPRLTAEEIQRTASRQGMGTIGKTVKALAPFAKVAGPVGVAYEALRSEPVGATQTPEEVQRWQDWQSVQNAADAYRGIDISDVEPDYGMGGGIDRFGRTRAGPDIPAGYDLSAQMPGLAGTQTGMPVAMDAGGAVGGYPTMDADYGTMATEEFDYVPADPTGGMIDADALAGRFDVRPTSMAQVAGTRVPFVNVPSESSYHVSPQTDQDYLDLGVTPPGSEIAHPSESPMLDQRYTDAGYYGDPKGVIEDVLAGILGGTINPAEVAVGGPQLSGAFPQYAGNPYGTMATEESDYGPFATPNFAGQQAPYGGPMMDTSLMSGFGKVGENVEEFVHYKDLVDKLVASGAVKAPTGYVSSVDVTNDLALPNIQHAMSSDTYGYQSGLKAALANEILGMGPKTWGTSQDIQELGRKFTGGGATPAMMDAQKQEGTRAINAALASPTITAQDQVDAYNAASMGEIASHPGQGGYIGDTERTIGEHLAAVDERVQAMPAVTTSQALSTQDERQQAMPTQEDTAAIARQNALNAQMAQEMAARLRQQQAAVAQERAAQQAAEVQASRDRVAAAQAVERFMASRAYQETGVGLTAAQKDALAAAQVDAFATGGAYSGGGGGGYVEHDIDIASATGGLGRE